MVSQEMKQLPPPKDLFCFFLLLLNSIEMWCVFVKEVKRRACSKLQVAAMQREK